MQALRECNYGPPRDSLGALSRSPWCCASPSGSARTRKSPSTFAHAGHVSAPRGARRPARAPPAPAAFVAARRDEWDGLDCGLADGGGSGFDTIQSRVDRLSGEPPCAPAPTDARTTGTDRRRLLAVRHQQRSVDAPSAPAVTAARRRRAAVTGRRLSPAARRIRHQQLSPSARWRSPSARWHRGLTAAPSARWHRGLTAAPSARSHRGLTAAPRANRRRAALNGRARWRDRCGSRRRRRHWRRGRRSSAGAGSALRSKWASGCNYGPRSCSNPRHCQAASAVGRPLHGGHL